MFEDVNIKARCTDWRTLQATGPDTHAWLNGLLTPDVEAVQAEHGEWGLLLSKRGKIICDVTLVPAAEGLWLGTPADAKQLHELLNEYLVMEDVECELLEGFTWITLHGPGALGLARAQVSAIAGFAQVAWSNAEAVALLVADEQAGSFLDELEQRHGVQQFDDLQWASWRVQQGVPAFGIDFGPDDNPHQASLERRTVSWTKGCYLGQEVVCMQDMRGKTKRRLVRLSGRGPSVWQAGAPVTTLDGQEVGSITTADPLVHGEAIWALARVKAPHFEPGSQLRVLEDLASVEPLLPT